MSSMDVMGNVLARIGSELDGMAGRLSRVTVKGGGASAMDSADLQAIDSTEQTLRCLATVLKRAARSEVSTGSIHLEPLMDGLPLDAVADVVRGAHRAPPQPHGDLDLF